jgi:cellobiose-specific phosphotransferase system component IIC
MEPLLETHPELIKKRGQVIALRRTFLAFVALIVVAGFTFLIFNAITATQARRELLDCTTPQGECNRRQQAQTSVAITNIVEQVIEGAVPLHMDTRRIVILAAYCADREGAQARREIEECVYALLSEDDR